MKFGVFVLFMLALTQASPVEEPFPEAEGDRSSRQFFPQYYNQPQQHFYPRLPYRYPYFFQPSSVSFVPAEFEAESTDVTLRAGDTAESRLGSNMICTATSAFSQTFICTVVVPFANNVLPTPFQMCSVPNNLSKASGVIQLKNGVGPRSCSFFISLPDNTKAVTLTCTSVNLTGGTLTATDLATGKDATNGNPIKKDVVVTATKNQLRLDFTSPNGFDNFRCNWKAASP